jgi:hypothetical protein
MRQIGIHEYFPPLPKVDLLLYRAGGPATAAAMALHDYLSRYLSGVEEIPTAESKAAASRAAPAALKLAEPRAAACRAAPSAAGAPSGGSERSERGGASILTSRSRIRPAA